MTEIELEDFIREKLASFSSNLFSILKNKKLKSIIKNKNPYITYIDDKLFSQDIVKNLCEIHFHESFETIFGTLFEDMAYFVASNYYEVRKPVKNEYKECIDFECIDNGFTYGIQVKSGPNWANSTAANNLAESFQELESINNNYIGINIICYGNIITRKDSKLLKLMGQEAWAFLSKGDYSLYKTIFFILQKLFRELNLSEEIIQIKNKSTNILVQEFEKSYCVDGKIDYNKILENASEPKDLTDSYQSLVKRIHDSKFPLK